MVCSCPEMTHLTRSPMETMPITHSSWSTGRWRKWWVVMVAMHSSTVCCGGVEHDGGGRDCSDVGLAGVVAEEDALAGVVALREDADQAAVVEDEDGANVVAGHFLEGLVDGLIGGDGENFTRALVLEDRSDGIGDLHRTLLGLAWPCTLCGGPSLAAMTHYSPCIQTSKFPMAGAGLRWLLAFAAGEQDQAGVMSHFLTRMGFWSGSWAGRCRWAGGRTPGSSGWDIRGGRGWRRRCWCQRRIWRPKLWLP